MELEQDPSGVVVATPHVPDDLDERALDALIHRLLSRFLRDMRSSAYVLWYLTPMAITFTSDLSPAAVVFDCMDDLSQFAFAPTELAAREVTLMERANLVFTGGRSLYEARRHCHANVHCCPSSVDVAHFARARTGIVEPADQSRLPRPRLGYAGVIDERIDLELLTVLADARPDWRFVLLGPIVKIDPRDLPQRPNVHVLGPKPYAQLPAYLAHWDVALLPFAHNAATRFISPTKTPEYLAAGLPVVSTSIHDVVSSYGDQDLVRIADTPLDFERAVEAALDAARAPWLARVDAFLAGQSWEATWAYMRDELEAAVAGSKTVVRPSTSIEASAVRPQRAAAVAGRCERLRIGA